MWPTTVATTCLGLAASMGCVILAGGAQGKRSALPNSTMLLHQPAQGIEGFVQATDLEIRTREIIKVRERLEGILVESTGQPKERIHQDTDRDYYLTAPRGRGLRHHRQHHDRRASPPTVPNSASPRRIPRPHGRL